MKKATTFTQHTNRDHYMGKCIVNVTIISLAQITKPRQDELCLNFFVATVTTDYPERSNSDMEPVFAAG